MTHILLFLIVSAAASFACTLMKTRRPDELIAGSLRFFAVLVIGIFLLGVVIQVTQSLGGVAGIICVAVVAGAALAYHYVRPREREETP